MNKQKYCIFTNLQEIKDILFKLGYENIQLIDGENISEDDKKYLTDNDFDGITMIYSTNSPEQGTIFVEFLPHEGKRRFTTTYDMIDVEKVNNSIKEAFEIKMNLFPTPEDIEKFLKEKDKKTVHKCGNCNRKLYDGEKYCRYCGTESSKGKYVPYDWAGVPCAYGPPVKEKYKCTSCGYTWISQFLGGENAKRCPKCGNKVQVTNERVLDFILGWGMKFGPMKDPFDEEHRPQIFTEEEVKQLLDQRKYNDERNEEFDYDPSFDEKAIKALQRIGKHTKEEFEKETFPETEKDAEEIILASDILSVQGDTPLSGTCHNCGNRASALINYEIYSKHSGNVVTSCFALCVLSSPLMLPVQISEINLREKMTPAYECLCCGTKSGYFNVPGYVWDDLKKEGINNNIVKNE